MDKCEKCGVELNDETKCTCKPTLCKEHCECDETCNCGCKADKEA